VSRQLDGLVANTMRSVQALEGKLTQEEQQRILDAIEAAKRAKAKPAAIDQKKPVEVGDAGGPEGSPVFTDEEQDLLMRFNGWFVQAARLYRQLDDRLTVDERDWVRTVLERARAALHGGQLDEIRASVRQLQKVVYRLDPKAASSRSGGRIAEGWVTCALVEQLRLGGVPRDVRLMAAQGLLPLNPRDLLELWADLVHDADAGVRAAAEKSLSTFPAAELRPILKRWDTPPAILSAAIAHRTEHELVALVLQNHALPDEAIEALAPGLNQALAELVVINQTSLLRCTSLLVALESNPGLSENQKRRLRQLRQSFRIGEAATGPPPDPAPLPAGGDAEGSFQERSGGLEVEAQTRMSPGSPDGWSVGAMDLYSALIRKRLAELKCRACGASLESASVLRALAFVGTLLDELQLSDEGAARFLAAENDLMVACARCGARAVIPGGEQRSRRTRKGTRGR
jgi:hypothetical protein